MREHSTPSNSQIHAEPSYTWSYETMSKSGLLHQDVHGLLAFFMTQCRSVLALLASTYFQSILDKSLMWHMQRVQTILSGCARLESCNQPSMLKRPRSWMDVYCSTLRSCTLETLSRSVTESMTLLKILQI
jgi:hypothetical protein